MQQTQQSTSDIMLDLKNATQPLHDDTEAGQFNKELVMGRMPLAGYVESLAQFFLLHRSLENHLKQLMAHVPAFQMVLRDYQFQEPYLRADLVFFGRDPDASEPTTSVTQFIAKIDQMAITAPISLLGVHYVFEGSNNGSKYISNALRRAYALEGDGGVKYFDPYGNRQREYWQAFKADMSRLELTTVERINLIDAACATFVAVRRLHDELHLRFAPANLPGSAI